MAKLLYIEASPRKQRSHSIEVAKVFLEAYQAAHPADEVDKLDLWSENLPRFDGDMLNAKYALMHGTDPSAAERTAWQQVERVFKRFGDADKYLFSIPMWNFSIPYVLKHYIDVITQPGLAWSFAPATGYTGLVTGTVVTIYSSGGAYHAGSGAEAFDFQKTHVEAWLGFIGLTKVTRITVGGTLFGPEVVAEATRNAIADARRIASEF